MKNNLLTEIERIKDIMFLNESSNKECEKQLEDDGYIVYNRTEQLTQVDECNTKSNIKCVMEWFDSNGIESERYDVGKHLGLCYITIKSEDNINHTVGDRTKSLPKRRSTFWENGDLTYVRTMDIVQTGITNTSDRYSQVQFKGEYECNGSELKAIGRSYQGVYHFGNTSKLDKSVSKTFMTKKSDGSNDDELQDYANTDITMNTATFN
jgi:hypothetical protein